MLLFFLLGLMKPRQNSRSDKQITQEYLQKEIKKDIFTQNISTFTLLTQFICLGILNMENLDRFDLRILAELQKDSRISNQELAERIGLSPSPCSRRVKQLEDEGYITKQVALLDRKRLGLTLTAYILIGMDRHTPERFENFQNNILQWSEVQECSLITGMDADYQLKVVVPDMEHYQLFLLNKLTRIEGVTSVRSSFVLNHVSLSTSLPLDHLRKF